MSWNFYLQPSWIIYIELFIWACVCMGKAWTIITLIRKWSNWYFLLFPSRLLQFLLWTSKLFLWRAAEQMKSKLFSFVVIIICCDRKKRIISIKLLIPFIVNSYQNVQTEDVVTCNLSLNSLISDWTLDRPLWMAVIILARFSSKFVSCLDALLEDGLAK